MDGIRKQARQIGGHAGHDACEDHQREALTPDTVLGDQFTQPDGEHGAGGHRQQHGQRLQPNAGRESKRQDHLIQCLHRKRIEDIDLADGRERRHGHGQDVCPAIHPAASLAGIFLHPALQRRDDRDQELEDDLGGDVRVDAHRKQREVRDRAARKQVKKPQESACPRTARAEGLQGLKIHSRHRNVGGKPVQCQDAQRDEQLAADVFRLPQVAPARKRCLHAGSPSVWTYCLMVSTEPPAASILARALALTRWTRTLRATFSSPRPSTLTGLPALRNR